MHSTHEEVDLRLRIKRRETAADGVAVFDLEPTTTAALPAWAPGAHVDLVLTPELTRQYSLCGDPDDPGVWRVAVLREPQGRGGSTHVHDRLAEGALIQVRGPRNHFALEPSRRYVFIAGGIGVTPIIPMMRAAQAAGAQWELHYGGRNLASMAFWSQLTGDYDAAAIELYPQDEVGLLDIDRILSKPRPDTLVYCCGPEPLLQAVEQRMASDWPAGTLRVERFVPRKQTEPVLHGTFEVELATTGVTVVVSPQESVLDAVRAAGVDIPSSCEEGTCGTCETRVLAGAVDHHDSLLSAAERAANDTMFLCVSRAASPRLVLDL